MNEFEVLEFDRDEEVVQWGDRHFDCPHEVGSEDVERLLDDWQSGRVELNEIRTFVELLAKFGGGLPVYPTRFTRSIRFELLRVFIDEEFGPLLERDDIPLLREVLDTADTAPREAREMLEPIRPTWGRK